MKIEIISAWLKLGLQVVQAGAPAWESLRAALAPHGIETDNATLNAIKVDAERRRLLAQAESE